MSASWLDENHELSLVAIYHIFLSPLRADRHKICSIFLQNSMDKSVLIREWVDSAADGDKLDFIFQEN